MQLMHVYVQKSISTTRPRSDASVSGLPPGVLNERSVSVKSGAVPKSRRLRASASSVDWLAFAGATRKPLDPLRHAEEPFAGANLGRWPEIWCRRLVTALEHSSEAVRFTSGMFCATNWSKLTASLECSSE